MSLMYCNKCKQVYGPTLFVCPSCGSTDVQRAQLLPPADNPPIKPETLNVGALTKEVIFNEIIRVGSGYFQASQLSESEEFTLFAESVAENLVTKLNPSEQKGTHA